MISLKSIQIAMEINLSAFSRIITGRKKIFLTPYKEINTVLLSMEITQLEANFHNSRLTTKQSKKQKPKKDRKITNKKTKIRKEKKGKENRIQIWNKVLKNKTSKNKSLKISIKRKDRIYKNQKKLKDTKMQERIKCIITSK